MYHNIFLCDLAWPDLTTRKTPKKLSILPRFFWPFSRTFLGFHGPCPFNSQTVAREFSVCREKMTTLKSETQQGEKWAKCETGKNEKNRETGENGENGEIIFND